MTTTALARRVLLLTSDATPIPEIETQLETAGYEIRRCHEPGEWFPCVGLATGSCPLDEDGGVDVALDVRQHPWPDPTTLEAGATCAIRDRVPLAVLGRRPHPFGEWAAVSAQTTDDVAALCEQAIDAALGAHRAAVTEAVRAVLENHDLGDVAFEVEVQRQRGRIHVTIRLDAPKLVRGMSVTRAASALRAVDPGATSIEIDVVGQR